EQEFTLTKIAGGNRINVTGKLEDASPLTEAERGIIQPGTSATRVAGDPDPAAYRPDNDNCSATITVSGRRQF
ncbi:MAG: hypothetical protein B7Y97_13630, partial [Sphingomonas sp. 32-66-10]